MKKLFISVFLLLCCFFLYGCGNKDASVNTRQTQESPTATTAAASIFSLVPATEAAISPTPATEATVSPTPAPSSTPAPTLSPTPTPSPDPTPIPTPAYTPEMAVGIITCLDSDGQTLGSGSAFIIRDDGLVVTAAHCVTAVRHNIDSRKIDSAYITLQDDEGNLKNLDVLSVVNYSITLDIAILQIDAQESLPYLKLGDSDQIVAGKQLQIIGTPTGDPFFMNSNIPGSVSKTAENYGVKEILLSHSTGAVPGLSGGAVLDPDNNDVIGVYVGNYTETDFSLVIPSNYISVLQNRPAINATVHDLQNQIQYEILTDSNDVVTGVREVPDSEGYSGICLQVDPADPEHKYAMGEDNRSTEDGDMYCGGLYAANDSAGTLLAYNDSNDTPLADTLTELNRFDDQCYFGSLYRKEDAGGNKLDYYSPVDGTYQWYYNYTEHYALLNKFVTKDGQKTEDGDRLCISGLTTDDVFISISALAGGPCFLYDRKNDLLYFDDYSNNATSPNSISLKFDITSSTWYSADADSEGNIQDYSEIDTPASITYACDSDGIQVGDTVTSIKFKRTPDGSTYIDAPVYHVLIDTANEITATAESSARDKILSKGWITNENYMYFTGQEANVYCWISLDSEGWLYLGNADSGRGILYDQNDVYMGDMADFSASGDAAKYTPSTGILQVGKFIANELKGWGTLIDPNIYYTITGYWDNNKIVSFFQDGNP